MRPWEEVFGEVPASFENMVQETLNKLEEPSISHRERQKSRTTIKKGVVSLIAAILVFMLCGTAYAIISHKDFFEVFFGSRAVEALPDQNAAVVVEAHEFSYEDELKGTITYTMPGYELVEVDEEEAERLLGGYVTVLDDSYTVDGYTVELLGYIEDNAGSYRLYYSIENPNGLDNIDLYDNNGYTCVGPVDWSGFKVLTNGSMAYADMERTTDTKVYVCVPGVVSPITASGCEVRIYGAGVEPSEAVVAKKVVANDRVGIVTGSASNYEVAVSPMGIKITQKTSYENYGFQARYVSITMEDSSEYLVYEKDVINNNSYSCGTVDMLGRNMGEVFCFNRIIDPEQIATVTVKGIMDQESTVIIF